MQKSAKKPEDYSITEMNHLINSIKKHENNIDDKDLAVKLGYRQGYISECRSNNKASEKFLSRLRVHLHTLENPSTQKTEKAHFHQQNEDVSALIRSNAQLADAVQRMVLLMEAKEKSNERIETNLAGMTGRLQRCETYALTLYKVVQQHRSVVEQVPLKKVQSDMDKVLYSTGQEVRQDGR